MPPKLKASTNKRKREQTESDGNRQRRRIEHERTLQDSTQHPVETSTSLSPQEIWKANRTRRRQLLTERRQKWRSGCHTAENDEGLGPNAMNAKYLSLNTDEYVCSYCGAIMWFEERVKHTSTKTRVNFSLCCSEGKIYLPKLQEPPEFLKCLLDYETPGNGSRFRQQIRMYNSCYQFTSMGANIDKSVNRTPGSYVFRISGQVNHKAGSLLPVDKREPSFLQLYVYDTSEEIELRANTVNKEEGSPQLNKEILIGLQNMLDDVNPLAQSFRTAKERLKENNDLQLSIRLLGRRENKSKMYNRPTASEIAALIVGDVGGNSVGRDIIIDHKSEGLKRITDLHPSFMALQYPLLFPYGEDSYYEGIPYNEDVSSTNKKKRKREYVTMREYYAYRLQQRLSDGYSLLRGGRLLQQYIVDCYCATESERLWYIRTNQSSVRCEVLSNICDAVTEGDYRGAAVGKRIFLPATFTGGPRYMQAYYQDAMAICRCYGNPHLFITFTANSNWPEVTSMLRYIKGQKAEDRPDIMARIFKLKLAQLMDCLKKEHYFGKVIADVYTIEFQKRGLPHAHILLWLEQDAVQITPRYIDSIIQAEIPDKEVNPELYKIVSQSMVHGPCGDANPKCPCMVNKICTKNFPKSFNNETTIDNNGYPIYRRRQDNRYIEKGEHKMDNRHIVPYNPGLLLMFDAHINVEWCNTAHAIKYLFKYIMKGPDKATALITNGQEDEINAYLDCRYLSACEASWRLFGFDIHDRNPSVTRLPVHLPGQQLVVLNDNSRLRGVMNRAQEKETMLTAWLSANSSYPEARTLTYAQFPTEYVWKDNTWVKRSQGRSIGRITYVHPTAGERYYLRLLLNIVKGATSFEDIRTINGHIHPTYKDACFALGLLNSDKEWHDALKEANQWAMPSKLRELFVTMLLFCEITDVKELWERSYNMLSDDIEHRKRKEFNHPTLILQEEVKRTYTLI